METKKALRKKGVTLVEMIMYASILSILTITTVSSLIQLNRSLQSIVLNRILDDAAQEVMEKIVREIRFSDSVNTLTSSLGVNPSTLVLNSTDTSGSAVTIKFSISASTLEFYRAGVLVGPLTPASITIDELLFDHIVTSNSEAVKVSLVLQANRNNLNIEKTFSTTVLLRGSY